MPGEHYLRVSRTARYYTLGDGDGGVRELWFVLHGYGFLAARFVRSFESLADGSRLIVAPEALSRFYLLSPDETLAAERPVGASWMTREDREHEMEDYVSYLAALDDHVRAQLPRRGAGLERVVVVGFSQGTATAARWVSAGQLRPTHLVLWGGVLPPELDLHRPDHPLRDTQLLFVVGDDDHFVTPSVLQVQEKRLRRADVTFHTRHFRGGHVVARDELTALASTISAH